MSSPINNHSALSSSEEAILKYEATIESALVVTKAPSWLRGPMSGLAVPVTCMHLDAKIYELVCSNKTSTPFYKRMLKDPLMPYRNGALKLSWSTNMIKYGTLIGTLEPIKQFYMSMAPNHPKTSEITACATAGILEAITTCPTSYFATQIKKAQLNGHETSPKIIYKDIPQGKLVKHLFSGVKLAAARNASFAMGFFPMIEPIKNLIEEDAVQLTSRQKMINTTLASGLAGSLALSVSQPFATAALVERSMSGAKSLEVIKKIYAEKGIAGFYKGVAVSIPRMFVASATLGLAANIIDKAYHALPQNMIQTVDSNEPDSFTDSQFDMRALGITRGFYDE